MKTKSTNIVLDCTIRDGGLVNNWNFSVEFVRDLYDAINKARIDYMEIGYRNSPASEPSRKVGPWRFCHDSFLKEALPSVSETKLSAMVDVGKENEEQILPASDSPLDMIRIACYIGSVEKALEIVKKYNYFGYETAINIMAVSTLSPEELMEALLKIAKSDVDVVYIVDSYGSLYPWQMEELIALFRRIVPDKMLGIHAHNNLQMAHSNTILAARNGVQFLDSTVYGMGRAAGNCPTELLLNYFRDRRYELRPILEVLEKRFITLKELEDWGYAIPYTISGVLNQHPRQAIRLQKSKEKQCVVGLYDGRSR